MRILLLALLMSNVAIADIIIDEYSVKREKEINKLYEACEAAFNKDQHWGRRNICRKKARDSMPKRNSDKYREMAYGKLNRNQALLKIKELQTLASKARETTFSLKNEPNEITTGTIVGDINYIRYKVLKDDPKKYYGTRMY